MLVCVRFHVQHFLGIFDHVEDKVDRDEVRAGAKR